MNKKAEPQIEFRMKYPYTNIPNDLIRDKRLRLQTRAVLILMLSLPPDWDFSIRGMAAVAGVSKDTMGRIMGELQEYGYLRRKRQDRENGGRFGKACLILTDDPEALFDDEEGGGDHPCPTSPCPEKSPQQNKDKQNTPLPPKGEKCVRKRTPSQELPDWMPDKFAAFWEYYRTHARKENKQGAIRAWDKLKPDEALQAVMGKALAIQVASNMWQRGVGIPYASTWLNGRRWEEVTVEEPEEDAGADPWDAVSVDQPEGGDGLC